MQNETKVTIDTLDFRLSQYQKSDQQVFGPRFGSGVQDETDLTLLKATTFRAGDYGSYVPRSDILTPYLIAGGDYASIGFLQKATEAVLAATVTLGAVTDPCKATAQTYWNGVAIIALRSATTNYIYQYNSGGTVAALTIPAALSTGSRITSFAEQLGALFVATETGPLYYITTSLTMGTTTGAGAYKQIFNLAGKMYIIDPLNSIYVYTGTTGAKAETLVCQFYFDYGSDYSTFKYAELNGRGYFATPTGLMCFDQVRAYKVLNTHYRATTGSFDFLAASAGFLYFNKGNAIYRFNGSSVERILNLPVGSEFVTAVEKNDKLYLLLSTGPNIYEQDLKGNPSGGDYGFRLFVFDGEGMYQLDDYRITTGNTVTATNLTIGVSAFGVCVTLGLTYAPTARNSVYVIDYKEAPYLTETADKLQLIFRDADFDLPSINKKINSFQLTFQDDLVFTGGKKIEIYYRLDESDAWTLCKTFQTTSAPLFTGTTDIDIPKAKRYFFRVDIDGTNVQFTRFTIFYFLMPPLRLQWNLTLNPATNSIDQPQKFVDDYYDKLYALRSAGETFNFVDLDGDTYRVLLDSFTQNINPAYTEEVAADYQSQFSVVLREV